MAQTPGSHGPTAESVLKGSVRCRAGHANRPHADGGKCKVLVETDKGPQPCGAPFPAGAAPSAHDDDDDDHR